MKKKISVFVVLLVMFQHTFFLSNAHASLIDETISSELGTSNISVSVRSLDNGKLIYQNNGDVGIKPASTLKLLTASAALDVLGENYRFTTELYIDGQVKDNVLNGNLYVKGGGDPTLQEENFKTFSNVLKRAGITSISGHLYGDDSMFIGPQLTPGIAKHDESYYYAARTSALTMSPDDDYDSGTILIEVNANTIGKSPTIDVKPNLSGMIITNKAITVDANDKNTIEIYREYNTNKIFITGNIPFGDSTKEWISVLDPTINTLHALKQILKESGISFSANSMIDRKVVPTNAELIYTKKSIPLKSIMTPFLKLSNNGIADILVKTMGKEQFGVGSLQHGLQVLNDYGRSIGLEMNQWSFEDGSGMSHSNRITANQLSNLLFLVKNKPYYPTLYNSLPIGGIQDRLVGGSLKDRYKNPNLINRVVAKTGYISGVYTLAGYFKAKSGKQYIFSILTQEQTTIKLSSIDEVVETFIENY
ncbi:D-alanyl-D-alanine carboxypeptidase/D-alanyl-D-alanine endopeptidase [Ureibacillus sp. MALMAid1270]|uniref:D-alanyl-D-alanine carboxypeptidase/D-alanyl-D-alanine endopeptidase n=1 Tax=Ureibacillus sp. MALMAid1270 TaxID=3411629 RepID=UPI003BA6565B